MNTRTLILKDQRAIQRYGQSIKGYVTFSLSNKAFVLKAFGWGFSLRVGYPRLFAEKSGQRRIRRLGPLSLEFFK